jgi:hypothetical protein
MVALMRFQSKLTEKYTKLISLLQGKMTAHKGNDSNAGCRISILPSSPVETTNPGQSLRDRLFNAAHLIQYSLRVESYSRLPTKMSAREGKIPESYPTAMIVFPFMSQDLKYCIPDPPC